MTYRERREAGAVMIGRDVAPGDAITFAPGNKPIRFARIDPAHHLHPTLGTTYRLAYTFDDTGYVLFDDWPVWLVQLADFATEAKA